MVEGIGDLHVAVVGIGDLLLLDASRLIAATGRVYKAKGKQSKGEYLAYPRVLRPLLSIYAFVSNGKGRLYIVD